MADVSGVQHGFWVMFGTLAVLRSNALSTGQNILRALAGTTVGFIVGGALVYLIGTNTTVLWILLPAVILIAGLAPATISFAAVANGRLVEAVAHDLRHADGHSTGTGVKVIWTGDHLDAVRRLQGMLVEPARAAVAAHALESDRLVGRT